MGSENRPLSTHGIYHSLPTFDPSITNLSAIVTGANGISGFHTMRVLLQSPQRWSKVFALSRRPPPAEMMALLSEDQRSRVQHVACDFLESPEKIAKALVSSNVSATHIFFYSYLQPKPPPGSPAWSNVDELVKVNGALFENFVNALPLAKIEPTRILLQTGAKNYGMHIGRARTPAIESDPQPKHLEPNFYYKQEPTLFEFCQAHPKTSWNVIMPAWIIGAVNNAQMNALHPFAIYAAVQAQKNEPLFFPGDWRSWQGGAQHSTAMLTGYLSEWVVLEDKCKNEAFNSADTSPLSFDRLYEELARWFGVAKGVVGPEEDESKYMAIKGRSGKETPMGYGPAPINHFSFFLTKWAEDPINAQAWRSLMASSGGKLTQDPFTDVQANFTFGDAALFVSGVLSMNKARRLGWTGFVDTRESIFEMYSEMARLGMLPPMKVHEAKPLV